MRVGEGASFKAIAAATAKKSRVRGLERPPGEVHVADKHTSTSCPSEATGATGNAVRSYAMEYVRCYRAGVLIYFQFECVSIGSSQDIAVLGRKASRDAWRAARCSRQH